MNRRVLLVAAAGSMVASFWAPPSRRRRPGSALPPSVATNGVPSAKRTAAAPSKVLFVFAHPDDETLNGVPIAEHLAAGLDVTVLLITDGEASSVLDALNGVGVNPWWGVRHDPAAEGYALLTRADIGSSRLGEAQNALDALATGYPGTLRIERAGLPDGAVTAAAALTAILAVADAIAPGEPVRLKGHTWSTALESHPDHLAVGEALAHLGAADPVRFGDRRYYVEPGFWSAPAPAGITLAWDYPTDSGVSARVINATRCYGAWAPDVRSYAIGYHSKSDWLTTVASAPRARYHS